MSVHFHRNPQAGLIGIEGKGFWSPRPVEFRCERRDHGGTICNRRFVRLNWNIFFCDGQVVGTGLGYQAVTDAADKRQP